MPINIKLKKPKVEEAEEVLFPEAGDLDSPQLNAVMGDGSWTAGDEDGQLAVDVCETDFEIVLRSAIAGVNRENLSVFLHNDMLTVRGVRNAEDEPGGKYLVRECHWGQFSRSVILPSDVDPEGISATLKDGVLTVRLPKVERSKTIQVNEL
ncbi:MAG: Hsp20/alpha crystallin family protein [Patescibacteria group bacterium]|nr:Hsp20/alpha crystallin family protein [Patescibacteria group bacterium]